MLEDGSLIRTAKIATKTFDVRGRLGGSCPFTMPVLSLFYGASFTLPATVTTYTSFRRVQSGISFFM